MLVSNLLVPRPCPTLALALGNYRLQVLAAISEGLNFSAELTILDICKISGRVSEVLFNETGNRWPMRKGMGGYMGLENK